MRSPTLPATQGLEATSAHLRLCRHGGPASTWDLSVITCTHWPPWPMGLLRVEKEGGGRGQ